MKMVAFCQQYNDPVGADGIKQKLSAVAQLSR